jgi:hypothetical protein
MLSQSAASLVDTPLASFRGGVGGFREGETDPVGPVEDTDTLSASSLLFDLDVLLYASCPNDCKARFVAFVALATADEGSPSFVGVKGEGEEDIELFVLPFVLMRFRPSPSRRSMTGLCQLVVSGKHAN